MAGDQDQDNPDSHGDLSAEPTLVEPNDPLVGKVIGKYQILGHIAQGGTATVYRALDSVLNRDVAIKILHEHLGEKEEVVARFKREAQFIAQLRHPNILTVYDFFEYQGRAVLVVEFMPGLTLADLLKNSQKIPEDYVFMLGLEVLKGLQAAHERGITHRDVKPANILLNPDQGVKISDFGLAKVAQYDDGLTKDGIFVGTPSFSSPEQIEGKPIDARSDIFSFGLTLYILATRKHAFKQRGDSTTTVWFRTVKGKFDGVRQVDASLSADLERIVEKCLQVDRDKRYTSAKEVIRDMESFLSRRGLSNYQESLKEFLKDPQSHISSSQPINPWVRVSKTPLVYVIGAVLAVVFVGALVWMKGSGKNEETDAVDSSATAPVIERAQKDAQPLEPAPLVQQEQEQQKEQDKVAALEPVETKSSAADAVSKPVRQPVRMALPVSDVSRVILVSSQSQPGFRWSWSGPSTFLLARDAAFSNLVVKETELAQSYELPRLSLGSYFWKAGGESGRLNVELYKKTPDKLLPVTVRSAFGESVDLDLNPWSQSLRLDWSGGPRASAYVLEVSTDPSFKTLLFRGTLVQKFYVLDRSFSESQKIYWRVSYEDESRNVFFVEPIRAIQLNIAGFSNRLDLGRMPPRPRADSKRWNVLIGAPSSASIQCQAQKQGASLSQEWLALSKTSSAHVASIPLSGSVAYLICDYRLDDTQSLIVIP